MRYEIYHDESQVGGYWHGMLLLPLEKKPEVVVQLSELRKFFDYKNPIGIKNIGDGGKIFNFAQSWINYGIASLIQNLKGGSYEVPIIRNKIKNKILKITDKIGAKFILFREVDSHRNLMGYPDYASKVETTFRMALKGALHLLGDEENPIEIIKIHFDGHEHYQRNIDKERIIDRIKGLRSYCSFADGDIVDDRTSKHTLQNCQNYDDCQLLQLTDLLIGSFRISYGYFTNPKHKNIAHGTDELIEKVLAGKKRMNNSRWNNGFCMSQCQLKNDYWEFSEIIFEDDCRKLNMTKSLF